MTKALIILKGTDWKPDSRLHGSNISFEDLKLYIRDGTFWKHLFRYQRVTLSTIKLEALTKPLLSALLIRLLSRGRCELIDESGTSQRVNLSFLSRKLAVFVNSWARKRSLIRSVRLEVTSLLKGVTQQCPKLDLSARPVYLRTDLTFGLRSGGSVGHIAGVLNHLGEFSGAPIFLTTDRIPTVSESIETHLLPTDCRFWDFRELPTLDLSQLLCERIGRHLIQTQISFLYQRYSINNYTGLKVAHQLEVPFVLEYNGSEVWINRHWGNQLRYEDLSIQIELLNLMAANLIVVVSEPLKCELVERGIHPNKILVNPNGVDPERYSPATDGAAVRAQYKWVNKIVIGFIGTFGKWHGAELLAESFGRLLQLHPEYREQVRLLMIGDGPTMPQVKDQLLEHRCSSVCILTGLVPQEEGPSYLAACDILVSPHVPNSDGSRFFGSPTKLFEYMAMGKAIVASDLEQIGEVLSDNQTAILVRPGDSAGLTMGLKTLIDDPGLRRRLGEAARQEVLANFSWRQHARRIVDALKEHSK